ncbi:Zinc finger C2H2-type [Trinorchestia longiramus]|nr:Zinc finger C2H2-type [Trinorchestia longiramus]
MVVLEAEGMLTAGSNQYLQPDYLSPVSTTLDSKKSPLALLAQTCSQIGADSSKPLPSEKKKDVDEKKDKTPTPAEPPRRSPAFKPYESSTPRKEEPDEQTRPTSSQASVRPSSTASNGGSSHNKDEGRRSSEASTSSASATPIIRSGLEVLAGHPKDVPLGTYRAAASSFFPPGYPSFDTHPAFRGAHPGLLHPSFSLSGLASLSSYPGLYPSMVPSQYISYTRVKTAGGGDAIVPVCRDPYCTGCPYSLQNNHLLLSGGACPPSCTQCEQAKAALSAVPGLSSVPPSSLVPASSLLPPTTVSSLYTSSLFSAAVPHRGFTCSWMAGADSYCGKRFNSADELLQHLRSHTTASVSEASALSMLSNPLHAHAALLNSAAAHSALHRPSFSPPSLSPLARYHPYSKPPTGLTPSLSTLPPYPATALTSAAYPGYPSPYTSLYPRPSL